jgi:hypothetical protein
MGYELLLARRSVSRRRGLWVMSWCVGAGVTHPILTRY